LRYDNCDEISHGRPVDCDLRIDVRCAEQNGRNLETASKG